MLPLQYCQNGVLHSEPYVSHGQYLVCWFRSLICKKVYCDKWSIGTHSKKQSMNTDSYIICVFDIVSYIPHHPVGSPPLSRDDLPAGSFSTYLWQYLGISACQIFGLSLKMTTLGRFRRHRSYKRSECPFYQWVTWWCEISGMPFCWIQPAVLSYRYCSSTQSCLRDP